MLSPANYLLFRMFDASVEDLPPWGDDLRIGLILEQYVDLRIRLVEPRPCACCCGGGYLFSLFSLSAWVKLTNCGAGDS